MSGSNHIAVVGAGPAGLFATDALLKEPQIRVDVFERLVAPYGLVRYGVAPDHQKIKSVEAGFARTLSNERVRYFGNVELGRDVSVDELRSHYDQVLFAMGCEAPRRLGAKGEDVPGVHSALEMVSWYNAHPDHQHAKIDLNVSHVVIVGAGDVSMDLVRLLASSHAELAETDMPDYAIQEFSRLRLQTIEVLIRRGPAHANFALKELRAVLERKNIDVVCDVQLLEETLQTDLPTAQRNKLEYLREKALADARGGIELRFRFLCSPVEFVERQGRLSSVVVEKNRLLTRDDGSHAARGTGEHETLNAELALLAVGYQGMPVSGVPLNAKSGLISNVDGRLVVERAVDGQTVGSQQPGSQQPGSQQPLEGARAGGGMSNSALEPQYHFEPQCYVVGWLKRGPQGVIGTNKGDARATVATMLDNLSPRQEAAPNIEELLTSRQVNYVSFADWTVLDALERERGGRVGKPREKFVNVADALASLKQHAQKLES